MNESTKSTPLLTWLRLKAFQSVVFKHCDRATIGIPDASLTWQNSTTWMEFKLFRPGKKWHGYVDFEAIAQKHPVQYEVAKRLATVSKCYYVVWVVRSKKIWVWNPRTKYTYVFHDIPSLGAAILDFHNGGE